MMAQKSGFQLGRVSGTGPKTVCGTYLFAQNNDFQGAKQTIQPLAVGNMNRLEKVQNGGVGALFACM